MSTPETKPNDVPRDFSQAEARTMAYIIGELQQTLRDVASPADYLKKCLHAEIVDAFGPSSAMYIGLIKQLACDALERSEAGLVGGGLHAKVRTMPYIIGELQQALQDVCEPLGALKRQADAEGARLNHHAHAIAHNLGFVQDIARKALTHVGPNYVTSDLHREQLRNLVDVVWNEAHEDQSVPDTEWADRMIDFAYGRRSEIGRTSAETAQLKDKAFRLHVEEALNKRLASVRAQYVEPNWRPFSELSFNGRAINVLHNDGEMGTLWCNPEWQYESRHYVAWAELSPTGRTPSEPEWQKVPK